MPEQSSEQIEPGEYDESEAAPLEADAGDVVDSGERYDPAPSRQILKDPTVGTDEAPNVEPAEDPDRPLGDVLADDDDPRAYPADDPAPLSSPDE